MHCSTKHLTIFLLLLMSSCSEINPDSIYDTPLDVDFLLLTDESRNELEVYPRLAFSCGDWTGMEIEDNSGDKKCVFQFINRKSRSNMLVICAERSICFVENNPQKGTISDDATIFEIDGNSINVLKAVYDWDAGTHSITSINSYEITSSNHPLKSKGRVRLPDDERKTFYNMLDDIGERISTFEDIPAKARDIAKVWAHVVIPAAKYQLYSNDPDIQDEIRDEIAWEEAQSQNVVLKAVNNVCSFFNMVKDMFDYRKLKDAYEKYRESQDQSGYDSTIRTLSSYPSWTDHMRRLIVFEGKDPDRLDFSMNYTIDGNSATITAEMSTVGPLGYISESGFNYGYSGGPSHHKEVSSFPSTLVIDNLIAGKEYWVTAYAVSLGVEHAKTINFTVDAVFSVEPTSLQFGPGGGSMGVAVTVPVGWKWRVAKHPAWCTIDPGNISFFVDVKSYKGTRTGIIEVVANPDTKGREQQTAEITISQGNLWDGTQWQMHYELYNYHASSDEHLYWMSEAMSYDSVFYVEDTSTGKYTDYPGMIAGKMTMKSEKVLTFSYSESETSTVDIGDGEKVSSTIKRERFITITMKDENTLIVSGSLKATVSGFASGSASADLKGSGTLISRTKGSANDDACSSSPHFFFNYTQIMD